MNINKTLLLFSALAPAVCSAQTQVTEYNPGATAEGVVYALPATGVNVDVTAIKTVYVPGEFAKYADRFLHIQGVRRDREEAWEVKNIAVSAVGVPDTLKIFTIKQKEKSSAAHVQFTKNGVLAAINTTQELNDMVLPASVTVSHALDGRKYMTSEMLEAASSAKIAELVAQEIFDIRDSKNSIRRGEAESMPKDGESLRIVLADLDTQEEALMQMFTGHTDTTYVYKRFVEVPKEDVAKKVMFRFSKKLGFVDTDDMSGAPYYINVTDKHTVQLPTEKEAAKRKINGVVYNLPSLASVSVTTLTDIVFQGEMPMGQFGNIDMLNNALFNKGAAPKVTFNTATGALLRLEE